MARSKEPQKEYFRITRREFCKTAPCAVIGVTVSSSLLGFPLKDNRTSLYSKKSLYNKEETVAGKIKGVRAKVISQKGTCGVGHKVGDVVNISGNEIDGKICIYALSSTLPMIIALMNEAQFSWAEDPDTIISACPDDQNPVVFEIKRLREK